MLDVAEVIAGNTPTLDLSTIDFSSFTTYFVGAIVATLGISISFVAIRKGVGMLMKALKKA